MQQHHRNNHRAPLTPEQVAAKQRRQEVYQQLTSAWEEAGLDAAAIWKAKLKFSGRPEVIELAKRINKLGFVYTGLRNQEEFAHFYQKHDKQIKPLSKKWRADAEAMALMSGCVEQHIEHARAKVNDREYIEVPTSGANWRLI